MAKVNQAEANRKTTIEPMSQVDLIKLCLVEGAEAEQLRSLLCPDEELDEELKEKKRCRYPTFQQVTGWKRRTENILIDMIDAWPQKILAINEKSPMPRTINKPNNRKRKRRPRTIKTLHKIL